MHQFDQPLAQRQADAHSFGAAVAKLREAAQRAGREPSGIALAYCAPWYKEGRSQALEDGTRRLFSGSDADVAEDIAQDQPPCLRSLGYAL